ncbi:MAG: hypothetical protein GF307_08195, partial [candidate division Zixibacteria bacterium]|nr:hypothetical protein [candidate division Zixibacteria bacterium]
MTISDRYPESLLALIPATLFLLFLCPTGHADQLAVNINAGNYNIVDQDGKQVIEMNDFDFLMVPGKPMLPAKLCLIALPPGAVVESVDVRGFNEITLQGTYNIKPTPPVIPLSAPSLFPEEHRQLKQKYIQNNESVYKSNNPYPAMRGKLTGKGTLRKYSYVSTAFYPFDYYPQTGKLTLYRSAEILINYNLPPPGSEEFARAELLKHDTAAYERASRIFINFPEIEQLYQPGESSMAVPLEDHDYVIITTEQLYDAIISTGFVPWKSSLGYDLKIVFTSDDEIASQPGGDLAERIRNFLRDYYVSWGIEYVLIVGDCASIPMRYCYPDPYNHTYYPYDPFNFGGEVPTDYYYADLSYTDTESWDSDGDGYYGEYEEDTPDFLAEVYVGRIPTNVPGRIEYALNKITAFEQDRGTWKDNALHAGSILFFANQNYSGYPKVDGADYMHHIENDLMPGWTIDHYAEKQGLEISDYDWPAISEIAFIDSWRNGQYAVVNWAGHGAANGVVRSVWAWDDGDGVPESPEINMPYLINMDSNLDDDYPSIVFALSCLV